MNMLFVFIISFDGIYFLFKLKYDFVNVIFNLILFECFCLFLNIEMVWVFGDGISENWFI